MEPPSKFPSGAAFSCFRCHAMLGDTSGMKVLWCSRCCVTPYCSKKCQVEDWSLGGHKKDCRALEASNRIVEERSLAEPIEDVMYRELRTYNFDISPEICILALRSPLRLWKADQRNHTHLLELWFDYKRKGDSLRQRFELNRALVVPFELGLAGARPSPSNSVLVEGLPTLDNAHIQQRQKEHSSLAVAVLLRATDVGSGKHVV